MNIETVVKSKLYGVGVPIHKNMLHLLQCFVILTYRYKYEVQIHKWLYVKSERTLQKVKLNRSWRIRDKPLIIQSYKPPFHCNCKNQ